MSLKYSVGGLVDVFDPKDEVFCPATIIAIVYAKNTGGVVKEVRIHYLGWDAAEWDENITDLSRLHPAGSYVIRCKSWVQLTGRICHWPCFVYIRKPLPGSEIGATHLRESKRLLIYPCGLFSAPLGPYKHGDGVWLNGTHISPYCAKEEDRMAAGLKSPYKVNFQAALKEMAEANSNLGVSCPRIMDLKFQLEGSLEVSEAKNKIKEEQRAEAVRRQLALADAKAEAEENALRKKMKMARQLRVSSKSGSLDNADGDAKFNGIVNTNGSVKTKSATKLSNEDILRAIPDCVKEKAVQTAAALKAIRQKHLKHKPARNKTDDMSESDALPVFVSVGASEEMWDFKIKDFIPSLSPTSFYPLSHSHAVSSNTSSSSSSSSSSTHDSAVAVAVGGTDKRKWRDHSQGHYHNGRVSNGDAGNGEERARRMRLLELSRDTSGIAGIASNSDSSGGSSSTNNAGSSSSNSLSSKTSASSTNNSSGEEKTSSSASSSSSSSDNGGDCTLKNNAQGETEKGGDKERVGRDVRNKRKRFQVTRYPPSGAPVLIPPYLPYDALQYSTAATEVLALEEEEEEVIILSPKARLTRPGDLTEKKMKTETDVSEDLYNGVTDVNGAPDDISLPQYW